MADGDALHDGGVPSRVLADGSSMRQAAFPDQQHDAGRDELLADRSDFVDRVRRRGGAALAIGDAVAGDLHDLPVLEHGERQPGIFCRCISTRMYSSVRSTGAAAACREPCGAATGGQPRSALLRRARRGRRSFAGVSWSELRRGVLIQPHAATAAQPAPGLRRPLLDPNSHCRSGRIAYSRRASIRDRGTGHEMPRISCQAVLHSDGRM